MRPGELNILASVDEDVSLRDTTYGGASTPAWTRFARAWIGIRPVSQRESALAMGFSPTATMTVKARWTPTLEAARVAGTLSGMSLSFRNRRLMIAGAVNVEERNEEMLLFCSESVV